jgi:hypothetical protein
MQSAWLTALPRRRLGKHRGRWPRATVICWTSATPSTYRPLF